MRTVQVWGLFGALALVTTSCGGSDTVECLDDRTCGAGQRCNIPGFGQRGTCEACAAEETLYNGIDDDCDTRTRDSDLDEDGQNATDAPNNPGLDCDDNDPMTFDGARELCGDNKDNDCDGVTDEPDCGDLDAPTVTISSPMDNDRVSGLVPITVDTADDVGVVRLVVRANTVQFEEITVDPMPNRQIRFDFNTQTAQDGTVILEVEAFDLLDQSATARVILQVDNRTPPDIQVSRPENGGSYAGRMTIDADITDGSEVVEARFSLDDVVVATFTEGPPYTYEVDTSSMSEGRHDLLVYAQDANDNADTRRITFFVDRTAPVVRFESPVFNQRVTGDLEVTVTATDAAGIAQLSSGGDQVAGESLTYTLDTVPLENGPYMIWATAVDATVVDDGQTASYTSSVSVTIIVDNPQVQPLVSFVTPTDDGSVLGNTLMEVSATSPAGSGITQVEMFVNGQSVGSDDTAPYQVRYDFTGMTGTATISATAGDASGFVGTASVSVNITPMPAYRISETVAANTALRNASYDIADMDEDGVPDVVTAGAAIQFMKGRIDARGRWHMSPGEQLAAVVARDVRLVDVDNDQDLDIVAFSNNAIIFVENLGGFTFGTPDSVLTPQGGMTAFAVADLDGDLDLDIAVVGGNTAGVVGYVFSFMGGGFVQGQTLGGDFGVVTAVMADLDQDNDQDIVVGRSGRLNRTITVYFNAGNGTFGAGQDTDVAGPAESVDVGDVTGDGVPDIVCLYPSLAQFEVLTRDPAPGPYQLVRGTPITTAGVLPSLQPSGVVVDDIAGNSWDDVIISTGDLNGVIVHEASPTEPNGFVLNNYYVTGLGTTFPKLFDADGDQDLDVFTTAEDTDEITYSTNVGGGLLSAGVVFTLPRAVPAFRNVPVAVTVGNAFGDDTQEILVTSYPDRRSFIDVMDVSTGVAVRQRLPLNGAEYPRIEIPSFIGAGRSVGTGYDYVVVGSHGPTVDGLGNPVDTLILLTPLGGGNYSFVSTMIEYPRAVAIADLDGDMTNDGALALDPMSGPDGSLVFGLEGGPTQGPYFVGDGAASVAVGLLNQDDIMDYAVSNFLSENVSVFTYNGTGFSRVTYNAPTGLGPITTGLVGVDPFTDIIGVAQNVIFVLEGDPTLGGFRTPVTYPAGNRPSDLAGGDFNGDGLLDVAVLNDNDVTSLLLARRQGGFHDPVPFNVSARPNGMASGELDGDGRPDLVYIHNSGEFVVVFYNDDDAL